MPFDQARAEAQAKMAEALSLFLSGRAVATDGAVSGGGTTSDPITIAANAISEALFDADVRRKLNAVGAGITRVITAPPLTGGSTSAQDPVTVADDSIGVDQLDTATERKLSKVLEAARLRSDGTLVLVRDGATDLTVPLSGLSTTGGGGDARLTDAQVAALIGALTAWAAAPGWTVTTAEVAPRAYAAGPPPTLATAAAATYAATWAGTWAANQQIVFRVPITENARVAAGTVRLILGDDVIASTDWLNIGASGAFHYYHYAPSAAGSGDVRVETNVAPVLREAAIPNTIARTSAIPTVPQPETADPQPLGTAAQGVSTAYSRGDHVHQLPDIPAPADAAVPGDSPKQAGTAAVGTSAKYARADHVHPGEAPGTSVTKASVYAQNVAILREGYRISLTEDSTKNEIDVSVVEVPSGNTLPPRPWHLGQRFNLLADQTIAQDRQAVYLEAESTPTAIVWQLPGLNLQLRAYGAGYGSTPAQQQLRNKVYLVRTDTYNFPPNSGATAGTITLAWYRTGQARRTVTVNRSAVSNFVHWHQVPGLTFADVGTTETQFGYLVGVRIGTVDLYPDAIVKRGGLIFNGGADNVGWARNPRNPAPWAEEGQPYPGSNLAITRLLDGPVTGLAQVSGGAVDVASSWTTLNDLKTGQPFDLTGKSGSIQFSLGLMFVNPPEADLGWGSRGIKKANVFDDFIFIADIVTAAGTPVTATGGSADVYQGTTKDATIRVEFRSLVAGSQLHAQYRWFRDGDLDNLTYSLGPTAAASRIVVWRQEPQVPLTAGSILDQAKATRTSADRNKFLGTSETDENALELKDAPAGGGAGTPGPAPFATVVARPASDVSIAVAVADRWMPANDPQGNEVWQTLATITTTAAHAGRVLFHAQVHSESSASSGGADRIYKKVRLMRRSAAASDVEHVDYIRNSGQAGANFQAATRIGDEELNEEATVVAGQHYDLQVRCLGQSASTGRTVSFPAARNYLKMIPIGRAGGAEFTRTLIARTPVLATTPPTANSDYPFGAWSLAAGAPSGFSTYPSGLVVPNLVPANLIGIAADVEVAGAVTARGLLNPGPVFPRGHALTDTAQLIILRAGTGGTSPNTAQEVGVQTFHNRDSNGLNGITVKSRGDVLPANTRVALYAVSVGPLA